MSPLTVAVLGFLLGLRHAVDPDHVAAVSTIATRTSSFRRAAAVGAWWGVGHTLTILVVGGAIILFRIVISPRIGLAMEFAVALMLILLGLQNVATARRSEDRNSTSARPFVVGMVHGMAGSAAVVLLVLATVRETTWAFAYLTLFGLGTVGGMVIVTACRCEAVFFDVPLEECLRRNALRERRVPEAAIRAMVDRIQPPDPTEGFALIQSGDSSLTGFV
jgi:high-affinity nickel-transport protein